jgi:hypothetical protein
MFRCSKDGLIADLFSQAGLKSISQTEIPGKLNCKTTDTYWSFVSEVVGPVVGALSQADRALQEKIKKELYQTVGQKYPDGKVLIESNAFIVSGQK